MGLVIGVGIFCFLFPFLAKWLSAVLGGKISPIVICYAVGILLANLSGIAFPKEVLTKITEISILLAIPLLLATANPKDWIRYAPGNLFAYLLGGASAALVSVLAAYFGRNFLGYGSLFNAYYVYTGSATNIYATF